MKKLKISVIVPFYNTPVEYFKECIDALKKLNPYEVILIDDCSDNLEVVAVAKKSGFIYKKTPYQSGFDGMPLNIGVQTATGDYICRIDSDDILLNLPTKMETDICFGNPNRVKAPTKDMIIEELILGPRAICNAIVAKTEIFHKHPFATDPNVYGDVLFVMQLLHNKYSFTTFPEVNYFYRKTEGSIQTSKSFFFHRLTHIQTVARFCQIENIDPKNSVRYIQLATQNLIHGSKSLQILKKTKKQKNQK